MCLKGSLAKGRTPNLCTVVQDDAAQDKIRPPPQHPLPPFRTVGGFGAGNVIVSGNEKYSNTRTP